MRKLVFTKSLRGIEDTCHFSGAYNLVQVTLVPGHLGPSLVSAQNMNTFGDRVNGMYGAKDYNPLLEVQMPFFSGDLRKLFIWYCLYMYEKTNNIDYLSIMEEMFHAGNGRFVRSGAEGCSAMYFYVPTQSDFTLHVARLFAQCTQPNYFANMTVEIRLYVDDSMEIPWNRLVQKGKLYPGRMGDISVKTEHAYLIEAKQICAGAGLMYLEKGFVTVDGSGYYHDNLLTLISPSAVITRGWSLYREGLFGYALGKISDKLHYEGFEEMLSYGKTYDDMYELWAIE